MSEVPYAPNEVTAVMERVIVLQDSAKGERAHWHHRWLVFDTESVEDEGWWAVVEYAWLPGEQAKRLSCWCVDGRWNTGSACKHENIVARFLAPKPEPVGLDTERRVDAAVFCE